jgi:hypothetical protein
MRITDYTARALEGLMPISQRKQEFDGTKYTGPMSKGPAGTVRMTVDGKTYAGGLIPVIKKIFGKDASVYYKMQYDHLTGKGLTPLAATELLLEKVNKYLVLTLRLSVK